jgi:hypothetical protein
MLTETDREKQQTKLELFFEVLTSWKQVLGQKIMEELGLHFSKYLI